MVTKFDRGAIDHNIPLITNSPFGKCFHEAFCEMSVKGYSDKELARLQNNLS